MCACASTHREQRQGRDKTGERWGGETEGEERELVLTREKERACVFLRVNTHESAHRKQGEREKESEGEGGKEGETVCERERECI